MRRKDCKEKIEDTDYLKVDMTGARYLVSLREKQEEMKHEILEFCRSHKGENIILAVEIYQALKGRYSMPIEDQKKENVILQGIIRNLLLILVAHGELEEKDSETGTGYIYRHSSEDTKDVA